MINIKNNYNIRNYFNYWIKFDKMIKYRPPLLTITDSDIYHTEQIFQQINHKQSINSLNKYYLTI